MFDDPRRPDVGAEVLAQGEFELLSRLDRATQAMAAASYEALAVVAAYDERERWREDGATSMTAWLSGRYGLSWGTAREWVRVAHALSSLPEISAAYARGDLSWDQLRPLTRFATRETDHLWARRAPGMRPSILEREAARRQRITERDASDLHRRRYLSLRWDHEMPLLYLEGMLPSEQGAALQEALEHRAERVVLADEPAGSPKEARLADALVELVSSNGRGEPNPATLVIHADASALTPAEGAEGPWLAETERGARVAAEAVRRLSCDGRIQWVLEREGRTVGIGRQGRVVPEALGRVLKHRDGPCRFPGCPRRRWLHTHHLVHWANGGATDMDNLVLLCHAHHRLIHEGGWRTSGDPTRTLRFHDPRGRPVHIRAP
jgi:uncharacterized protein DUF222/HNH endonuclease